MTSSFSDSRSRAGQARASTGALRSRHPGATAQALVGATIAGKYRVVRALGHGGMGTVYKAENIAIGKVVAIKLLHGSLTDDDIAMQRFEREARAMVAIAHPNIVDVLDMGRDASGSPFLVMEYVRGGSLKSALTVQGPLSVARVARIAGQVLDALAAAHRRGIIHRDLKPENILLTARAGEPDFVKVVDFGISTFADSVAEFEREAELTPTGLTMATPYYASPEQIRGANGRDPRVDIYAVGVLLFEMLSGHRPFDGDNLPELCTRILAGDIAPLHVFRKDVPAALEAVMRRALANSAGDRYQTALDFAHALVPLGARPPRFSEPPDHTDTFTLEPHQLEQLDAASANRAPMPPALRRALDAEPPLARPAPPQAQPAPLPVAAPPVRIELPFAPVVVHEKLARGLFGYFARLYGTAEVRALLEGLGNATRRALSAKACQCGALGQALLALDRQFARGDRSEIAAAGRYFVSEALAEGQLEKHATPELFLAEAGQLWQRYFQIGEARVCTIGRGYGRLEIRSAGAQLRPPLALLIAMTGALDEGLKRSGASAVSVRIAESTALGDVVEAFEASWVA